jgi:putative chitobiose transport system permease protein
VLIAALAAYPLARMRFRGRGVVFMFILSTMMIPEQVIVVPMFSIVVGMGMYDTLAALVVPFSVSAFGVYLCRQAFEAIPMDVEEAAIIDGASSLRVWRSVMLPLAAPTLATLAVFSVIGAWSDLLWPLVVLKSESNFTLPIQINELLGQFSTNIRLAYAASLMALLPIVVFFVVAQRWLRPNMFAGAVKG